MSYILEAGNFAKEAREAVVVAQLKTQQQADVAAKVKAHAVVLVHYILVSKQSNAKMNRARPQLKSPANNIIQSVHT